MGLWEHITYFFFEVSPIQSCEDKMKNAIAILAIISLVGIIPSDADCAKMGVCYINPFGSYKWASGKRFEDWQTCARQCNKHKSCSYFTYSLDGENGFARHCYYYHSNGKERAGPCISGHHTCTS